MKIYYGGLYVAKTADWVLERSNNTWVLVYYRAGSWETRSVDYDISLMSDQRTTRLFVKIKSPDVLPFIDRVFGGAQP